MASPGEQGGHHRFRQLAGPFVSIGAASTSTAEASDFAASFRASDAVGASRAAKAHTSTLLSETRGAVIERKPTL